MGFLSSLVGDVAGSFIDDHLNRNAANKAFGQNLYMSNTAYQRAVADMRAAGLNPILAYSQGGASTPSAPVAQVSDRSSMGSRAATNALTTSQVDNTRQNTVTSAATAKKTLEDAENQRLINEGLRTIPPEWRAAASMAGSTGLDVSTALPASRAIVKASKGAFKGVMGVANKLGTPVHKFLDKNTSLPRTLRKYLKNPALQSMFK